jgi:hypothetical protein
MLLAIFMLRQATKLPHLEVAAPESSYRLSLTPSKAHRASPHHAPKCNPLRSHRRAREQTVQSRDAYPRSLQRERISLFRQINSLIGLVARSGDPHDNRAIQLSLTRRGAVLFAKLIEVAQQRNAVLLVDLPPERRAIFLEFVEELITRVRLTMETAPP